MCKGITAKGKPCKNRASPYCHVHVPASRAESRTIMLKYAQAINSALRSSDPRRVKKGKKALKHYNQLLKRMKR